MCFALHYWSNFSSSRFNNMLNEIMKMIIDFLHVQHIAMLKT